MYYRAALTIFIFVISIRDISGQQLRGTLSSGINFYPKVEYKENHFLLMSSISLELELKDLFRPFFTLDIGNIPLKDNFVIQSQNLVSTIRNRNIYATIGNRFALKRISDDVSINGSVGIGVDYLYSARNIVIANSTIFHDDFKVKYSGNAANMLEGHITLGMDVTKSFNSRWDFSIMTGCNLFPSGKDYRGEVIYSGIDTASIDSKINFISFFITLGISSKF